jgi:hypothetical protein
MSECILALLMNSIWVSANRMLDTKRLSMLIVDELQSTVVATPLWLTTHLEGEAFGVGEVVPVFEYGTDAEFDRTSIFGPVEGVQIVPDEAVQVVSLFPIPPVSRR